MWYPPPSVACVASYIQSMAGTVALVCCEILMLPIPRLLAPLALQPLFLCIFSFLFRTSLFLGVANTFLPDALIWLRGFTIARNAQGLSS